MPCDPNGKKKFGHEIKIPMLKGPNNSIGALIINGVIEFEPFNLLNRL